MHKVAKSQPSHVSVTRETNGREGLDEQARKAQSLESCGAPIWAGIASQGKSKDSIQGYSIGKPFEWVDGHLRINSSLPGALKNSRCRDAPCIIEIIICITSSMGEISLPWRTSLTGWKMDIALSRVVEASSEFIVDGQ